MCGRGGREGTGMWTGLGGDLVRMRTGLRRGGSATGEVCMYERDIFVVFGEGLTKATGLGLPIAEKNRRPAPVTIWYPDDCINPCLKYSLVVVHCVHVRTSGPNLHIAGGKNTVRQFASRINK
jgi:hypothetical protein